MERYGKLSRLFTPADLSVKGDVVLNDQQAHYLKNVLRKNLGDTVRIFNGRDGEWLGELTELKKKSGIVTLGEKIRTQPLPKNPVHLLFAPIKKNRMDFLIEKAVELGATDLHPVLTARTDSGRVNTARLQAQITEAAEQCERMDIPALHAPLSLKDKMTAWNKTMPLHWCAERSDAAHIAAAPAASAFLIGPEGGFDAHEVQFLSRLAFIQPVSLGETVYRAETASLLCLASAQLRVQK